MLARFSGAFVRRTVDHGGAHVPEHAHDWPLLSLFVIGSYANQTEIGEAFIASPSAILYAAGASHRNRVGPEGFEQIEIEFDPAWLGWYRLPDAPVSRWVGGRAGVESQALVRILSEDLTETRLRAALRLFLEAALVGPPVRHPAWLDAVARRLRENPACKAPRLAREVGLHPSWLGTAYRRATGEGLAETAARLRVERAAWMLRETGLPLAAVATDAGFCDQSHMIRTFRRVLGRLPTAVRDDRSCLRGSDTSPPRDSVSTAP